MKRELFDEDHEIYRQSVREFMRREVVPKQEQWMADGSVDRETWRSAGEAGLLCPWVEERWGGPGGDFLHSVIVCEELARVYESGFAIPLHSDIVVPYIHSFGDDAQRERWLAGCVSGELISAIAMTEPDTGSDLAAIRTTARRDGDEYVINGSKTFISNGFLCDLVIVAAKTENSEDPHRAVSLFVVEGGTPGFIRSKKLAKMGLASQDTAEIAFEDCRIPAANRLGAEGAGFMMLMQKLQQERLVVGVICQSAAEQVLTDTIAYAKQRAAFGRPIIKFQNTQFKLAECATEVEVGRHFCDAVIRRHAAGEYLVKECSMSKLWHSEMLGRVVDECLQFYGGYGYMLEYPISRAYIDARVQRIYAGTNEIMKVIIAKQMGI
ncbi:acyl-CoA dehydrogenase family protein [Enhygromyxa salina]|uniref:Acyl-[acyl-carrier-protein] dehydrogenase MbtN n=1 Tax=Enhygromyxa salina TaxID=215803 RepID=A0A2S9YNX9_9BACT|nr:acyl-CoA dehydrogenase family protein [Enhygromyxa salina]PRQ06769.1 Acyl-CoA dehydrogenase [Enhygromyxa salina]